MVNFGSRLVLSVFMPFVPAIIVAYAIGMCTAFALNRLMVFSSPENSIGSQMGWFVAVNLAAVMQTVLISLLLARLVFPWAGMTFHPESVAHAIGIAVPVITSYYGHKHLSFKARRPHV